MNLIEFILMNPNERRSQLLERVETTGAVAAVLGFTSTVVSGIAFIASEPNLSLEAIQRLSTQINGFYGLTMTSIFVGGIGAAVALAADKIKK